MKFKVKVSAEYDVEAETGEEVLSALADDFDRENMTAENEFWDNTEIEVLK